MGVLPRGQGAGSWHFHVKEFHSASGHPRDGIEPSSHSINHLIDGDIAAAIDPVFASRDQFHNSARAGVIPPGNAFQAL